MVMVATPPVFVAPRYTIADLEALPDSGVRYELLGGALLVTPSPAPLHQLVATEIIAALHAAAGAGGKLRVVAPGAVERSDDTQLQPDVMVYEAPPGAHRWTDVRRVLLAVEILSPSTRRQDIDVKRPAYQALGVEETWLVDPVARTVEVWPRTATAPVVVTERLVWRRPELAAPLELDLADLFRDVSG